MPFTVSHIAAALPLIALNRWLPFAALAVGCMAPDLPLFIPWLEPLHLGYTTSHHWASGLFTSWLFGWLILTIGWWLSPAVVELLPNPMRDRMQLKPLQTLLQKRWIIGGSVALMLGGLSHCTWDAFTHAYGWGVSWSAILSEPVGDTKLMGYQIAQHGSSVMGLLLLVAAGMLWLKKQPRLLKTYHLSLRSRLVIWFLVIATIVITGLVAATQHGSIPIVLFHWITSGIQSLFIFLIVLRFWYDKL